MLHIKKKYYCRLIRNNTDSKRFFYKTSISLCKNLSLTHI